MKLSCSFLSLVLTLLVATKGLAVDIEVALSAHATAEQSTTLTLHAALTTVEAQSAGDWPPEGVVLHLQEGVSTASTRRCARTHVAEVG